MKTTIPLDYQTQRLAADICKEQNGRIQNWRDAKPSTEIRNRGEYFIKNCGRYSSSCRYTRYEYTPVWTSFGEIGEDGILRGQIGSQIFEVKPRKGFVFAVDSNGICLQRKNKTDSNYHFNCREILGENPICNLLEKLRGLENQRKNQKKLDIQKAYHQKIFQREIQSTYVTLEDSRKSGNCIEGSLNFAEKNLGISRDTILNGLHLFSVQAKRLIGIADKSPEKHRIMNAVNVAWSRETMVSI